MICSRCGAEIGQGGLFCDRCGAIVQERREGTSSDPIYLVDLAVNVACASPDEKEAPIPGRDQDIEGGRAGPDGPANSLSFTPLAAESKRAAAPKPSGHPARFLVPAGMALAVLVLIAGLLWPGWFRGERGELSGPEQVVDSYFQAMARRDGAAILSLFLPGDLEEAMRMRGLQDHGALEEGFNANLNESFPQGDLRFSGLKYETTMEGEEEAVVRVTAGRATYTDSSGEKVTETPESGGNAFGLNEFRLKSVESRWYLKILE